MMLTDLDVTLLLKLGSSTLHEACPAPNVLPASLRPIWPGASMAGPAYPFVAAPGDNLALHWALELAEAGDVLIVDAHDAQYGHWGEVMAVAAQTKGIAGIVIAGGVRDVDEQQALGFPVFASSVTTRGTTKRWSGRHGEPVILGQATIRPGDVIVADADGVVAIPASNFQETLDGAQARTRKEEDIIMALRQGQSTLDIYDLRQIDSAPASAIRIDSTLPGTQPGEAAPGSHPTTALS